MGLNRNQKLIVDLARWRGFTAWQAFELIERGTEYFEVEAYYRSDECLDAVSAAQEAFGSYK